MPSKFAWLAAPGIYIGDIKSTRVTDESALLQRSVITNARLLAYPEASKYKFFVFWISLVRQFTFSMYFTYCDVKVLLTYEW